jgi:Uma2 family endonuclease
MEQAAVVHFEGVHVPSSALSHEGFREWVKSDEFPETVQASFVGGEIFLTMSPESIDTHNQVKVEVTAALHALVRAADLGTVYADRALLTHEAARLSTEPDAMVATWETLESGRLRSIPKKNRADDAIELVGTPDLVVEIVSDSSVRKDLVALRERYARAGIPEYWIIDARAEAIRFEILLLGDDGYAPMAPSDQPQPSPLLGRSFELTRAKSRIGTWTYTLSSAPR